MSAVTTDCLLDKWLWTQADFDQMGWHDSLIHGVAFAPQEFEIVFDIDYIVEWVSHGSDPFEFWVAPATLVFSNVHSGDFAVDPTAGLEILDISRADPRPVRNPEHVGAVDEWLYTIDCAQGEMKFRSAGYQQYFRAAPRLGKAQHLALNERGGYSFYRGRVDPA